MIHSAETKTEAKPVVLTNEDGDSLPAGVVRIDILPDEYMPRGVVYKETGVLEATLKAYLTMEQRRMLSSKLSVGNVVIDGIEYGYELAGIDLIAPFSNTKLDVTIRVVLNAK